MTEVNSHLYFNKCFDNVYALIITSDIYDKKNLCTTNTQ